MRSARFVDSRVDRGSESGFTLVELLLITVLLPMIVGSMTLAIILALQIQSTVSTSVGSSGDAQQVSSVFYGDVQGALAITTSASAAQCGTGTQILGLEWGLSTTAPPVYQDVASYVVLQNGTTHSLVRNFCSSGSSVTPNSSTTLANNISVSQSAPVVSPSSSGVSAQAGWAPAQGVTSVAWTLSEPTSGYSYILVATPAVSESSTSAGG